MSEIIGSIDRALDILLCLYDKGEEMGVTEIGRELNLYKSTVHRTLNTLEQKDFVYQNRDNGKYWLGSKIYIMGLLVGEKLAIHKILEPYTQSLHEEFGEVVNVSMLDEYSKDAYKTILIHKESDNNKVLTVNPSVGSRTNWHCSSVGKCLMAFSKEIDIEELKDQELYKHTENTITDWEEMKEELELIRQQGYAIDKEEQEIGLYCVGVPILDRNGHAVYAISISGPTNRMKTEKLDRKIQRLIEISRQISLRLR